MAIDIARRKFIVALGRIAFTWPLAAHAQQAGKLPTVGILGSSTQSSWVLWIAAFLKRLRELGWNEGRTVAIEYRWAEGREERYAEIAAEFVRLKVDVIVTTGSSVLAPKQATSVIPIVFALANDPVGSGYVASLSRPGGNITGLSIQTTDTADKRLELLREVVPGLRRVAILANLGNPSNVLEADETRAAARTLGLEVATSDVRRAEDIAPAFEALKNGTQALYVCADPLFAVTEIRLNTLALSARLPTIYGVRGNVASGGLMSYGANTPRRVPARRRPCRQDSARHEAGRHPRRAADQVRSHHQSHHRQGARDHRAALAARPRR